MLDRIVESVREGEAEAPLTEEELFVASGLKRPEPVRREPEENSLAEFFGMDEPDPRDPAELEAEEEIRVYEPGSSKKEGIPILTEETDPELAPIKVKNRSNYTRPAKTAAKAARSASEKEETEQKRRPFMVVLLLLAVLLIAAVVARILISAFGQNPGRDSADTVAVNSSVVMENDGSPAADTDVAAIMTEEEQLQQEQAEQLAQQQAQQEAQQLPVDPSTLPHSYEAVRADVGWLQAQQEAQARGGYLVTINSQEELDQVIALAEEAGFDRVWIGAHRVDNNLYWESGEDVTFYFWDQGEPSFTDSGDGTAEDYLMLWNHGGVWCYNDSRENPLTDFYGMYGGRIGYVVEKVG